MTIQQRLEQKRSYIIDSYKNGISTVKLGKEFNCNPGTIHYFLKNNFVDIKKRPENYGTIEDRKSEIMDLYSKNLSAYAIGKQLNIAKCTILRAGGIWGLDFSSKKTKQNPLFIKDQKDLIVKMHLEGKSAASIARELKYCHSAISEYLNSLGYDQPLNKHEVNLDFFKKIDTEIKAYVLGFWYADGNVVKDKIRLQITDLDILERIKKEIDYTGDLYITQPRKENHKTQYCLSIARGEVVEDMIRLGCVPNKTLVTKFPTQDIVPQELIRHFIRGYIDGDGNIYAPNRANIIRCQIVGTKEFLQGIELFAKSVNSKCSWTQRFPERNNNNHNLIISGNANCIKFLDEIYRDSIIHLDRKYRSYKNYKLNHA